MRHVGCLFLLSALLQNLELEQMDEHMGELNLNMCKSSCFLRETFAIAKAEFSRKLSSNF